MFVGKIPGHAVTYVSSTYQVDKDSLLRKCAFYVLKISLSIFRACTVNDGNQHCSSRSSVGFDGSFSYNLFWHYAIFS
jgi:hypothetical protein